VDSSTKPLRFVTAVWVKAQYVVRYTVLETHDLASEPRLLEAAWLIRVNPSSHTTEDVKRMLEVETSVPLNAIGLVEVHDA
jgi:hypothetical protein